MRERAWHGAWDGERRSLLLDCYAVVDGAHAVDAGGDAPRARDDVRRAYESRKLHTAFVGFDRDRRRRYAFFGNQSGFDACGDHGVAQYALLDVLANHRVLRFGQAAVVIDVEVSEAPGDFPVGLRFNAAQVAVAIAIEREEASVCRRRERWRIARCLLRQRGYAGEHPSEEQQCTHG